MKQKTKLQEWKRQFKSKDLNIAYNNGFHDGYKQREKEILGSLKSICYGKIDWIKVFKDAYEGRKTSWNEMGSIREWRNATDEVLFAFWKQFEKEIKSKGEK